MTDTQRTIEESMAKYEARKRDAELLDKIASLFDNQFIDMEDLAFLYFKTRDIRLAIELMDKPEVRVASKPRLIEVVRALRQA